MGNPHGANLRRCEARLFRAIVKPLILRCGPRTVKGKQDDRQSSGLESMFLPERFSA